MVLVVVALLALGAYTFSETMLIETEAAVAHERGVQTRVFVDSGVEFAAALLGEPVELGAANFYHNPEQFQGVVMRDGYAARGTGRFSIVAPVEHDLTTSSIRFGLINESSKLNVNELMDLDLEEIEVREMLMGLPGMSEEIADSILDWLDEDDDIREFGAELEYYETLDPPYTTKNGKLESLDELLKVAGVTPDLLFGEDANRNGLLDPNEDDGEDSPPYDDADGLLALGWSSYLTVHSRESNRSSDGGKKLHVNNNLLTELYDELLDLYGDEEIATFVIAYRMNGPLGADEDEIDELNGVEFENNREMEKFTAGIAKAAFSATGDGSAVTRGGMDLSGGATVKVRSLYDLIEVEVEAEVDGVVQTLQSPWTLDDLASYLPEMIDLLTTTSEEYIIGRININEARPEVLYGIPGMTEELATSIVGSQMIGANGEPLEDAIASHATTGWLLMEDLVDLEQMRELDEWLTTRGDVHRAQVVGFFDEGGPFTRIEAVVDATQTPPAVVLMRDLSALGRGYLQSDLAGSVVPEGRE